MVSTGVHKSQALGCLGRKSLYFGAVYLEVLSMENYVTPLRSSILRRLLDFIKVCGPLGVYIYVMYCQQFSNLL